MMKKVIPLLLAATLLGAAVIPATAAGGTLGTAAQILCSEQSMIKTGILGKKLCFSDADFKQAMGVPDFESITVELLPPAEDGVLLFAGRKVTPEQTIKRKNISSLCFIPTSENITESKFSFTSEGKMGGATMVCVMKFIEKINEAPHIEKDEGTSLCVWTQEGITVYGKMSAADPEEDALEYIVVRYPQHGVLRVSNRTSGDYRYTPGTTYTGKDRFTYVARDCYGNYSLPCEVQITVDSRRSGVCYADMKDDAGYNAAVVMNAVGVMSGTQIGDDFYFYPDRTVTRAEFVGMALKAAGVRPDTSAKETFFDDNDKIPKSLVGYVATAQRRAIVNGTFTGKALNFRPNDPVTRCEAAAILAKLIGENCVQSATPVFADNSSIPVWARSATVCCVGLGILDKKGDNFAAKDSLTRREVAMALMRLMNLS